MIRIAVVEDTKEDALILNGYIKRFQTENDELFEVKYFKSGLTFLHDYHADFDIVFMDIDLPGKNGLDISKELRERDSKVVLIFLTNLAKYAIKGYSVNAFDFVAKPITYYSFSTMLSRAITKCSYEKANEVTINNAGVLVKIDINSISFIEVDNHQLIYHTDNGDYQEWRSLSSIAEEFEKFGFAKGSSSYLINLRRVSVISGTQVVLNNKQVIYLSRGQKKEFAKKFTEFITGD